MLKLEGVATFVAVAEGGSISEAARRIGVSKSVVSERLADLERALGARLVQRTTRKMSLTEDGAAFLLRSRRILQDVQDAAAEVAERRGELVGGLRLAGPVSFGTLHLGPALYPFLCDNPGIDLSLDLDDRFIDIAADGYDAVVRSGPIRDDRLIVRRLAPSRRALVASPDYLARYGEPHSLEDLVTHRAILYANRETDWRFEGAGGLVSVRPKAGLRVNNGLVMRDAALAGLGVTLLTTFIVHREVASGALRILDIGVDPKGAEIYIAHPRDRSGSRKVTALTECLRRAFGDPPYWDRQIGARRD